MAWTLTILTTLAALLVLGVLAAGLWNLLRAGSSSRSQMLMRWRIGLQFAAIVIAMGVVYFTRS